MYHNPPPVIDELVIWVGMKVVEDVQVNWIQELSAVMQTRNKQIHNRSI